MGLKRFIYQSGLDVVAPLKCGTRWLEQLDVDNRIHHSDFMLNTLSENIHSDTTFIWRGVREHFYSAINTEWTIAPDKDVRDIIISLYKGECGHWYPHLYKELYPIWKKTGFQFHKLRALSLLTPSARELTWTSNLYKFHLPTGLDSIDEALSSLSSEHLTQLEICIGEEEKWLESMIKPQYSKKDWEAYSDLEDSYLKMLSNVMDLNTEIQLKHKLQQNELEHQRNLNSKKIENMYSQISELKKSNKKLETKIEYAESLLGRKANKLI